MRISKITEPGTHAPLVLASAVVWSPKVLSKQANIAWLVDADAGLRALFPTIPEELEGPWGKLPRSDVLGARDLAHVLLDAMQTIVLSSKEAQSTEGAGWGFALGSESLVDFEESERIRLGAGVLISQFSWCSAAPRLEINPPASFFNGGKQVVKQRVNEWMNEIDKTMQKWIPALVRLPDPECLEALDLGACAALAERARLGSSVSGAAHASGAKRSL